MLGVSYELCAGELGGLSLAYFTKRSVNLKPFLRQCSPYGYERLAIVKFKWPRSLLEDSIRMGANISELLVGQHGFILIKRHYPDKCKLKKS